MNILHSINTKHIQHLNQIDFADADVVVQQAIESPVVSVTIGCAHWRTRLEDTLERAVLADATKREGDFSDLPSTCSRLMFFLMALLLSGALGSQPAEKWLVKGPEALMEAHRAISLSSMSSLAPDWRRDRGSGEWLRLGRAFSKENTQISSLGPTPTDDLVKQWILLFSRPPSVLPYPRIMDIGFTHFPLSYLNTFQDRSDSEKLASLLEIKS